MKKITALLLVCILLLTALPASALTWREPSIWVTVDGVPVVFDVTPQIMDNRTMVPMRAIFEAMGMTVEWDGDTQTVKAMGNGRAVECTIGKTAIAVVTEDGLHVEHADVAPQIVDNRTLVPVRFVAQALDCTVLWVAASRTVVIWTPHPADGVYTSYYDEEKTMILYQGEFSNNAPNGRGSYYYPDGSLMAIGNFKDGQLYGGGVIYSDGAWEEGNFVDNRLEGFGVAVFSNGSMYEGNFKNDLADGAGTYYNTDGSYFVGTFKEGQLYEGTLYRTDGETEVLLPPTE